MLQEIGKNEEREREQRHDSSVVFDAMTLEEEKKNDLCSNVVVMLLR